MKIKEVEVGNKCHGYRKAHKIIGHFYISTIGETNFLGEMSEFSSARLIKSFKQDLGFIPDGFDKWFNYTPWDGPGCYYESMVFRLDPFSDEVSNWGEVEMRRYSTREEAEKGHAELMEKYEKIAKERKVKDRIQEFIFDFFTQIKHKNLFQKKAPWYHELYRRTLLQIARWGCKCSGMEI